MCNKFIHIINYIYSLIWIWLNNSNKYEYRENSNFHKWIINFYM